MKKYLFIIISLIILFPTLTYASTNTYERNSSNNYGITKDDIDVDSTYSYLINTPLVDETEKIYDFADLYTDSEEEELYESISSFISKYETDIVIVTIDENNKYNARSYADDFYDYNSFGYGTNHDGILLLIDMDTREFYISTTGYMINTVNSSRVESILSSMDSDMISGNYYDATTTFVSNAKKYVKYHAYGPTWLWILMLILALVVAYILLKLELNKYKLIKHQEQASAYLVSGNIETKEDVMTNKSRVFIPHSSGGSGGGGGGGSHHSGSSGTSHGGGGHHF